MKTQEIIIIAAVAKNNVIGNKGTIPWHIKEDFEHFKKTTQNNIVIMGRKTWESLPQKFKPLPNRENLIISSQLKDEYPHWGCDLKTAIQYCNIVFKNKKIFLIGGSQIYKEGIEIANKMILSKIYEEYEGDVFFPEFKEENWKITNKERKEKFEILTYEKINP